MSGKLAALYRSANVEKCRCSTCGSTLKVTCKRRPSATHPRGEFFVHACHPCEQREAASRGKELRRNHVAPKFRGRGTELTQLHRRWREVLGLDALGFKPEQWVCGYRCDDVHRALRVIVEVNGDYAHANPSKYDADDVIVLEYARYTAKTKWASDAKRLARLRADGWKVLVVWESDDVDSVRERLRHLTDTTH